MSLTTLAQQPTGATEQPSNAGDKFKEILNYVPAEMVTLYVALAGLIDASAVTNKYPWMLAVSIGCLIGSAIWIIVANANSTTKAPAVPLYYRLFGAMLGFAAWVYALGYPVNASFRGTAEYSLSAALVVVVVPVVLSAFGRVVNSRAPSRSTDMSYLPKNLQQALGATLNRRTKNLERF